MQRHVRRFVHLGHRLFCPSREKVDRRILSEETYGTSTLVGWLFLGACTLVLRILT